MRKNIDSIIEGLSLIKEEKKLNSIEDLKDGYRVRFMRTYRSIRNGSMFSVGASEFALKRSLNILLYELKSNGVDGKSITMDSVKGIGPDNFMRLVKDRSIIVYDDKEDIMRNVITKDDIKKIVKTLRIDKESGVSIIKLVTSRGRFIDIDTREVPEFLKVKLIKTLKNMRIDSDVSSNYIGIDILQRL